MVQMKIVLPILALYLAYHVYKRNDVKKLPSPIVETLSGQVRGTIAKSRDGRKFYEYMGIPYAKPPVGDLRFESPVPFGKWEGVLNATSYRPACLQADITQGKVHGDEDCLFLNVFIPKMKPGGKLLPTMVWIHGGMFAFDSASGFGPEYFMDENIVLVTLNYRLGPFGFLSTDDAIIRGNMGLKDQNLALKWVQKNIKNFGGDPQQVTIFGESAGGASTHYHVLSPMSKGLFQRAISQSGVATAKWAARTNPAEQAERFSKILGCPTENSKVMAECLKSTDGKKIAETSLSQISDDMRDPITAFVPSIETVKDEFAFLTEMPIDLITNGKYNKVPWMAGVNAEEGLMFTAGFYRDNKLKELAKNFEELIPRTIWHHGKANPEQTLKIKQFYFRTDQINHRDDTFKNFTNIYTDALFGAPNSQSIRLQAEHSPVYPYYYSYKGEFSLTPLILAISGKYPVLLEYTWYFLPRWLFHAISRIAPVHLGACHFDEVALLFPLTGRNTITPQDKDYEMSKAMVKTWVAFAKNEDLDSKLSFKRVPWPRADTKTGKFIKFLEIDSTPRIIDEPNPGRNRFWENLKLDYVTLIK